MSHFLLLSQRLCGEGWVDIASEGGKSTVGGQSFNVFEANRIDRTQGARKRGRPKIIRTGRRGKPATKAPPAKPKAQSTTPRWQVLAEQANSVRAVQEGLGGLRIASSDAIVDIGSNRPTVDESSDSESSDDDSDGSTAYAPSETDEEEMDISKLGFSIEE